MEQDLLIPSAPVVKKTETEEHGEKYTPTKQPALAEFTLLKYDDSNKLALNKNSKYAKKRIRNGNYALKEGKNKHIALFLAMIFNVLCVHMFYLDYKAQAKKRLILLFICIVLVCIPPLRVIGFIGLILCEILVMVDMTKLRLGIPLIKEEN